VIAREHPGKLISLVIKVNHSFVIEVTSSPVSVALRNLSSGSNIKPVKLILLTKAKQDLTISCPLCLLSYEALRVSLLDEGLEPILEKSHLPQELKLRQLLVSYDLVYIDYDNHLLGLIVLLFLLASKNVKITALSQHWHSIVINLVFPILLPLCFP
jgi:hypothetical protein